MNLNQVTIGTTNVEKSISFYIDLGLTLIVHAEKRYARFEGSDGSSTFSLHRVDTVSENQTMIYFECDDLDTRVQKLEQKGIHFTKQPSDEPWLWREAHLADPDGNRLVLYYAGTNRLNPPWRIN